jgi:hypothetical protein
MWWVEDFKRISDNGFLRLQMKRIDRALEACEKARNNRERFIARLTALLAECQQWKIDRKNTPGIPSAGQLKCELAVDTLLEQVGGRLRWEQFTANKSKGQKQNLRDLQPGAYQLERTQFEQSKKGPSITKKTAINPVSGAYLSVGSDAYQMGGVSDANFDERLQALKDKDNTDAWSAHHNVKERVHFVRKSERICEYMLMSIGGVLYGSNPAVPYSTVMGGGIYAMDRYGNLICAPKGSLFKGPKGAEAEFRHSSLNAGRKVLSAGTIHIQAGQLLYIDNWSGHYRPSRAQFFAAIRVLSEEFKLDLTNTTAVCWWPDGVNYGLEFNAALLLSGHDHGKPQLSQQALTWAGPDAEARYRIDQQQKLLALQQQAQQHQAPVPQPLVQQPVVEPQQPLSQSQNPTFYATVPS